MRVPKPVILLLLGFTQTRQTLNVSIVFVLVTVQPKDVGCPTETWSPRSTVSSGSSIIPSKSRFTTYTTLQGIDLSLSFHMHFVDTCRGPF